MDARISNPSRSATNQVDCYTDAQGNIGQTADPRRYSLDKRLPKGQPIREARGVVALLENFQEFCAVLFCARVEVGWCCD